MLNWQNEYTFHLNGHLFQAIDSIGHMFSHKSKDGVVIAKTKDMLDGYCQLFDKAEIGNIFELGIFRGGSAGFLHAYCQPNKLVAIDIGKKPSGELARYIVKSRAEETLRPYYGVNQTDIKRLDKILKDEFQGEALDLVIDDASHFLDETRVSFNFLFPKLRDGGLYIIEDWSWAHYESEKIPPMLKDFENKPALTNILIEAAMSCKSNPGLVADITINQKFAVITRGGAVISDGCFDLSESYFYKGERGGLSTLLK